MFQYILDSYKMATSFHNGNMLVLTLGFFGSFGTLLTLAIWFITFKLPTAGTLRFLVVAILLSLVPVLWNFLRDKEE